MLLPFPNLSHQQLLDTAEYYFRANNIENALIYYNLFVNIPKQNASIEQQRNVIEVFNKLAEIYGNKSDYRSAYEALVRALVLSKEIDDDSFLPRIYNNIGNIYFLLNKLDIAKYYFSTALEITEDSTGLVIILNNLAAVELQNENFDNAFRLLEQAIQISRSINRTRLYSILSNFALYYQHKKNYDLALHYFRWALNNAREHNRTQKEVESLSGLANLFFEIGEMDSVLFYVELSNVLAREHGFLRFLARNYQLLAQVEESKGRNANALMYFRRYASLKDSIFSIENFANINQMQRLYETLSMNQQIQQLITEQAVKARTIRYQQIIQGISLVVLLSIFIVSLFIFLQKRKLNKAYKTLFDKSLKIADLENLSKSDPEEKYKSSALTHDRQSEMSNRILAYMEDISVICDAEFSVEKLAELLKSNTTYVSQVINHTFEKNFRSFLNEYRIREAQRLFSELDAHKYTIESVANQVGFKSRNAFSNAFKNIVGVSPNFYLKSMHDITKKSTLIANSE